MEGISVLTDVANMTIQPSDNTDDFEDFYRLSCMFMILCSAVTIYFSCPPITPSSDCPASFYAFRWRYLVGWYVCVTVDELHGAFLIALYKDVLHVEAHVLLSVGYASALLMGPVSGFLGDKFGRRRCCLLYCCTYGMACILLHVVDFFPGLIIGRVLSAFSQETLFTSFESYLVTSYSNEGLPGHALENVFAWMFFGDFIVAILIGGLFAQFLVDSTTLHKGVLLWSGDHFAPFSFALFLCIVGGVIVWHWKDDLDVEPIGLQETINGTSSTSLFSTSSASRRKASSFADVRVTLCGALKQRNVQLCGITVVGAEAPMFLLLMHFYDTLKYGGTFTSSGYAFACFMMSSMMGATLCSRLTHLRTEWIVVIGAFGIAAGWFAISAGVLGHLDRPIFVPLAFFAFNVIQLGLGLYFPAVGLVKSAYVPEDVRSSVYTAYRLPLNIIVATMANLGVIEVSGPLGAVLGCSAVASMLVLGGSKREARTPQVELSSSF